MSPAFKINVLVLTPICNVWPVGVMVMLPPTAAAKVISLMRPLSDVTTNCPVTPPATNLDGTIKNDAITNYPYFLI